MATYKVIQDIEAEDKFVGPLTLKQFVFAMFGALFAYLSFFVVTKGIIWGLIITFPPAFFGFFMAVPWSSEQPTDVWFLAKIRFRLKPKKRIWDQAGMQELVSITAPKKEEKPRTNNLSQTEVTSRLSALAATLDSRGWIIKNTSVPSDSSEDDRLIELSTLPQAVPEVNEATVPDMMEENRNLDSMIEESDNARKAQIYEKMDRIRQGESPMTASQPEEIVAPPAENVQSEEVLSKELKAKKQAGDIGRKKMHFIPSSTGSTTPMVQDDQAVAAAEEPTNDTAAPDTGVKKAQASMTEQVVPDILRLARNNDLNVATIARQAKKDSSDNQKEVVISLH